MTFRSKDGGPISNRCIKRGIRRWGLQFLGRRIHTQEIRMVMKGRIRVETDSQ